MEEEVFLLVPVRRANQIVRERQKPTNQEIRDLEEETAEEDLRHQ